jgi:hypothetical protein
MDYFLPKNFQIHQVFKGTDELIPVRKLGPGEIGQVDYYFGGKIYRHIGTWPPVNRTPQFTIPIVKAVFTDDVTHESHVCTELVRKYMSGPTNSPISFDQRVPRPHITVYFFGMRVEVKWVRVRKVTGKIQMTNVLGQISTYIVE